MSLITGIDLGTTSVKISLFDIQQKQIIASNQTKYHFKVNENLKKFPNYCQQNIETIVRSLHNSLNEFDLKLRENIRLISICGQMHGCVLWDNNSFFKYDDRTQEFNVNESVSDLYNWMDSRCDPTFLASLPEPDSYVGRVSSGFGCATIFWLQNNSSDLLKQYNSSGTLMDLIIAVLCHLKKPVMSTQNATGWGYYDPIGHSWNQNLLKSNGFPTHLLPIVQKPGSVVGKTKFIWLGIPINTPVIVGSGDMQCATYASLRDDQNCAVLSISTSMQMSVLMDKDFIPIHKSQTQYKSIDYFPYFDDRYLSVAASLNGGNVLQSMIESIKSVVKSVTDVDVSDDHIWDKIFGSFNNCPKDNTDNKIKAKSTMFGERHNTALKASIVNISHSFGLNELMEAFCEGLIDNIFEMMTIQYLMSAGVQRIIGNGTALLKNPILKSVLEKKLKIPVIYMEGNDADVGAVWFAYNHYYKTFHNLNH